MPEPIIPSAFNPTGKPEGNPEEQARERIAITDALQWLKRLDANEDFQRYLSLMKQGRDAYESFGANIDGTTAEVRDAWNQRRFAMNQMVRYAEEQIVSLTAHLKRLDESGAQ